MKKLLLLLCTFALIFGQDVSKEDISQVAFDFLQKAIKHDIKAPNLSHSRNIQNTLEYLKKAFVLYKQEISKKTNDNMQLRDRILNGKSEKQLFTNSNSFLAGLDFLCLAMGSNLSRHYVFALESFGKNEFLDEHLQLDKKSLIASLSTIIFMQNLSPYTQKRFSLYADLLLAQNKAYQNLEIHKQDLSDEEYSFYKEHIMLLPDSIIENAYMTKSNNPFEMLATMETEIAESLNQQKIETSKRPKRSLWSFFAFLWSKVTLDYEGNVFSSTGKYFPVVSEIVLFVLYLGILVLGSMNILDSIYLLKADNKEINQPIDWNLNRQKLFSIKNICEFLLFIMFLVVLYLIAIMLTHSGLLAQKLIGYIGIISYPVYILGYVMCFFKNR